MSEARLTHPLLEGEGVAHGFGLRADAGPAGARRPRQVHGRAVARIRAREGDAPLGEADAVVSERAGLPVAVATADCVPVLAAAAGGRAVAAVHAGWRGLAAGVVAAAVRALREAAGAESPLRAAIGPHIGRCCYEVDAPVLEALRARFGGALEEALAPARPGRARLDLGALVARELEAEGLAAEHVGRLPECCTRCDAERFHSHRRDGAAAGRLLHWIAAAGPPAAGLDTSPGAP